MEDKMLELKTRRELYEMIRNHPGLHLREISRQAGLLPSLVEYHLRYLIKNEFIYSVKEEGYKRFYASKKMGIGPDNSEMSSRQKKILHLLRQKIPFMIILKLLAQPTIKHKEIINGMDISGSTLSYYLKKMVKADILIQTSTGQHKGYSLKDKNEIIRIFIIGHFQPPTLVDGFLSTWEDFY